MNTQRLQRFSAVAMTIAALSAIAGFTALGCVFNYPKILDEPTADILKRFRAHETAVVGWFAVLVFSAALLVPIGLWLGRLAGGRRGRWIAVTAIAGAAVQVVGLSRWLLFVPGISDDALDPAKAASARHTFRLLHTWLGKVVGETIGYALTAAFTLLVVVAITRHDAPRWMRYLGYASAALIATGIVAPVVDGAGLAGERRGRRRRQSWRNVTKWASSTRSAFTASGACSVST